MTRPDVRLIPAAAFVLSLFVAAMLCGGCANFHARGDMANAIEANGLAATDDLAAPSFPPDVATARLNRNATIFKAYADAKTVNVFAYWFGGKTILVNGEYATRLDSDSTLAADTLRRATSQPATTQGSAWLNAAVRKEARVLLDVRDAKNGKVSAP